MPKHTEKPKGRQPTPKRILLAKIILENPSISMRKAMLKAGYSVNTAIAPGKNVVNSPSWEALMNKHIPDSLLAIKHNALLNKKEYIAIGKVGQREVVPTGEIDANAVAKGLDMAYKLKNRYAKDQSDSDANTKVSEALDRLSKLLP
jgi:hypothetical protein